MDRRDSAAASGRTWPLRVAAPSQLAVRSLRLPPLADPAHRLFDDRTAKGGISGLGLREPPGTFFPDRSPYGPGHSLFVGRNPVDTFVYPRFWATPPILLRRQPR
ncbi:hypothetical protein TREES_T100020204 [Tupaia chinensis]|uniref:Uncharacterized protein n=1 Tax=Tupaia chinensis TaxID=246437 RepID=L9LBR0_TUPCH|nr:hypothetical protein TREES_T100020204 [Tupaia chinensis]